MSTHNQPKEEVIQILSSNIERGLTSAQVLELQEKFGPNKLNEKKKKQTSSGF